MTTPNPFDQTQPNWKPDYRYSGDYSAGVHAQNKAAAEVANTRVQLTTINKWEIKPLLGTGVLVL